MPVFETQRMFAAGGCSKSPSPPHLPLRSQAWLKALLTCFQPVLLLPSHLPLKARTG